MIRFQNSYVDYEQSLLQKNKHLSVTNPVEHDPVDYYPYPVKIHSPQYPCNILNLPAIFMLPQWLYGVSLKYPAYWTNKQTNEK